MYIRPDAALERRFHPVDVVELTREQTLEVLQARRSRLEMHHVLAITDAALERALDLSEARGGEYRERKRPDKEIDLIDEACALERLRRSRELPARITRLVRDRTDLLAAEQASLDALLRLARERGNPLERFSNGTYRAFEVVGLRLERLLTGQTTPRPVLPRPESVRRLEASDPAARLRDAHRKRTRLEARIRQACLDAGLVIDAAEVERAAGPAPPETA
jgi:ATP-dependent Clp protease ATP-binding subunit ClpA